MSSNQLSEDKIQEELQKLWQLSNRMGYPCPSYESHKRAFIFQTFELWMDHMIEHIINKDLTAYNIVEAMAIMDEVIAEPVASNSDQEITSTDVPSQYPHEVAEVTEYQPDSIVIGWDDKGNAIYAEENELEGLGLPEGITPLGEDDEDTDINE